MAIREMHMNHSKSPITVYTLLLAIGIVAGGLIRFLHLGLHPLENTEATLALQAFQFSRGQAAVFSGHPLYLILTSILFTIFGNSNFLARFTPAVFGTLLLAAPLGFGKYLNKRTTILLVWLLAIEPGLVAASRAAGSTIIAICLFVLLLSAVLNDRKKTAAVLFGLILLSGPSLWQGVIIFGMTGLVWFLSSREKISWPGSDLFRDWNFWLMAGATFLLAGSVFSFIPNGLSAAAGSVPDFLVRWSTDSLVSIKLLLLALPFYTPLILIAGLVGLVRSWLCKDDFGKILSLAAIFGFVIILIQPSRDLLELAWVTLPLAVLASIQLDEIFKPREVDVSQSLIIAGFVGMILLFLWQVFGRMNQGILDSKTFWLSLGGGIVILLVCAILAILGWSIPVTGFGYAWGFSLFLALFTLLSAWRSAGISTEVRTEFWNGGYDTPQVQLLDQTIRDTSLTARGVPDGLDIAVLNSIQPALAWELRAQTTHIITGIVPEDQPALVITPQEDQLQLPQSYRGQDFITLSKLDWDSLQLQDWMGWLMLRKPQPLPVDNPILWVRSDLFPGVKGFSSSETQP
jgi:hypothetical protein